MAKWRAFAQVVAVYMHAYAWAMHPTAAADDGRGASGRAGFQGGHDLCVYTKVYAATDGMHAQLKEFVEHYISEGATQFFLLDDRSMPSVATTTALINTKAARPTKSASGSTRAPTDVSISVWRIDLEPLSKARRTVLPLPSKDPMQAYPPWKRLVKRCTWLLAVDVDEFATTRRHRDKTLAAELRDSFSDVDVVDVPWVMFAFDPELNVYDIKQIRTQLVHRWNHSLHHGLAVNTKEKEKQKKHRKVAKAEVGKSRKYRDRYDKIESKPLFRPNRAHQECGRALRRSVHDVVVDRGAVRVDSVYKRPSNKPSYMGLHETEIELAFFLINHYRFSSLGAVHAKCTSPAYEGYSAAEAMGKGSCLTAALEGNHPEVLDTVLKDKVDARRRRALGGA